MGAAAMRTQSAILATVGNQLDAALATTCRQKNPASGLNKSGGSHD
jgi:hypothetical protein